MFRTVAAVLHLGNVTFVDGGDEAAAVEAGAEEHLEGEWGGGCDKEVKGSCVQGKGRPCSGCTEQDQAGERFEWLPWLLMSLHYPHFCPTQLLRTCWVWMLRACARP